MNGWGWIHVFAAASGLLVAALAISRGGGGRLALTLALLAVDQFAFNVAALGLELTGDPRYSWVGSAAAPLFPALAFHFVATFLGRGRALRPWVLGCYVVYGLQSLLAAVDLAFQLELVTMWALGAALVGVSMPLAFAAMVMVLRHYRNAGSEEERWRSSVLLLALVTATLFLTTDPLSDMGLPVPRLGGLGSFGFNVLLMVLTLRLGLFRGVGDRIAAFGQALATALFAGVAYLAVFMNFSERQGVLIVTMAGLTMAMGAAGWVVVRGSLNARTGLERFATLGQFSAQMAHDLRNPLAAARGAAEYLAEEMRRAGQDQNHEFSLLIVQQLDRLGAVIERYQRLSKLEPERREHDLNALVRRVLSLQTFAGEARVQLVTELQPGPLQLSMDADLVASALENLVKNAFEAMPEGGTVTIRTVHDEGTARLSVTDTGTGMDARAREQAFELFFTTKATGSGMGLPFVRQVARAHGGDARLSSLEGSGTMVELYLPLSAPLERDLDHG